MDVLKTLRNIFSAVMTSFLVVMSAALTVQIISRQLFSYSFSWIPELSQLSLIAMVLVGSYVLTFDESHIQVDFLEMIIGKNAKLALALFRYVMMLAVIIVVVIGSFHRGNDRLKEPFMTLRFLRIGYVYYAMLLSFFLQGIWLIHRIIRTIALFARGAESSAED